MAVVTIIIIVGISVHVTVRVAVRHSSIIVRESALTVVRSIHDVFVYFDEPDRCV